MDKVPAWTLGICIAIMGIMLTKPSHAFMCKDFLVTEGVSIVNVIDACGRPKAAFDNILIYDQYKVQYTIHYDTRAIITMIDQDITN